MEWLGTSTAPSLSAELRGFYPAPIGANSRVCLQVFKERGRLAGPVLRVANCILVADFRYSRKTKKYILLAFRAKYRMKTDRFLPWKK
jgi:hypothetical protein